jgi:hypothetical protein
MAGDMLGDRPTSSTPCLLTMCAALRHDKKCSSRAHARVCVCVCGRGRGSGRVFRWVCKPS